VVKLFQFVTRRKDVMAITKKLSQKSYFGSAPSGLETGAIIDLIPTKDGL
jgi:hypothetical protein